MCIVRNEYKDNTDLQLLKPASFLWIREVDVLHTLVSVDLLYEAIVMVAKDVDSLPLFFGLLNPLLLSLGLVGFNECGYPCFDRSWARGDTSSSDMSPVSPQ